jgi:Spy/CpxP family protein refolding chaperone
METPMFAEFLLMTGLTMPLSPLPASDRHASLLDEEWAAEAPAPIQLAQAAPPAGGPPPMGARGAGPDGPQFGSAFLRGLSLTEAQQDAIFNLHHAQAPQMREQMKALRKARQALRDASHADSFDEQRASAAAADVGRIVGTMALMRARTEAAVWKLLTPEQRQQAERMRSMPMMHGAMGGMWNAPQPPR